MQSYRTQVKIIADVLKTAQDTGQEGVGVTVLLRKANLSYSRLTRIVSTLLQSGLIEEIRVENASRYRISHKGIEFLVAFSRFEEFANSFGLGL